MQKIIALIICGMIAFGFYTMSGIVIDTDTEVVVVETSDGNIWEFYGTAEIGDHVVLVMHNHGTADIYDDQIVEVF